MLPFRLVSSCYKFLSLQARIRSIEFDMTGSIVEVAIEQAVNNLNRKIAIIVNNLRATAKMFHVEMSVNMGHMLAKLEASMLSKDNTPIDEFTKLEVKLVPIFKDLMDFVKECNSDNLIKLEELVIDIADVSETTIILEVKSFETFKFTLLDVPMPKLAFVTQLVN